MLCELLTYECDRCGLHFEVPTPVEPMCVVVRTRVEGHAAALCGEQSGGIFGEVDALLAGLPEWDRLSDSEQGLWTWRMLGIICDPGPDGSEYEGGTHPACPRCGAREMRGFSAPPEQRIIDVDMPLVTHQGWAEMTRDERRDRLRRRALELAEDPPAEQHVRRVREGMEELQARLDRLGWTPGA